MSRRKKKESWGQNGFEDWGGYMEAKKAKLQEQFQEGAAQEFQDAPSLFDGIAIFVNGYTNPSADELKRLMMAYGGMYHHYMRPRITTHIIASNLPYSKIMQHLKSQNPVPICKPEWIVDSIKSAKLLDFQNYLLYSNYTKTQPQLNFKVRPTKVPDKVQKLPSSTESVDKERNVIKESVESSENAPTIDRSFKPDDAPQKTNLNSNTNEKQANFTRSTALSTKNPQFLSEFYNNSRLHHISTMGAMFKDYISELRDKSNGKLPGLERLKRSSKLNRIEPPGGFESDSEDENLSPEDSDPNQMVQGPVIMHIDMDCFFVSVGLRNKPELRGFPVAVTHAKGNKHSSTNRSTTGQTTADEEKEDYGSLSEVASCSYEARKAGVKNGMFLGQALKLCPNLKTIQYDFEGYKEVSYALYDTVASYTLKIEAVSCDEMYADCTEILQQSRLSPLEFADVIRAEIKTKTGCPVSTGFGQNKLHARLATRKAKPDGQFYLSGQLAREYIGTLSVRDLPGVGYITASKLKEMNIHTCAELQSISLGMLQKDFGKKNGEMLYNMSRGSDESKLSLEHVRKSVSTEVNYGIRFKDNSEAEDFLRQLTAEVCVRLKKANAKGRSVTLKLMVRAKDAPVETPKFMGHGQCDYFTRSKNIMSSVDEVSIITKEVLALWHQMQQPPEEIRGIGIQISRLEIVRNKIGDVNIINFVTKAKSSDAEDKSKACNNSVQAIPIKSTDENTLRLQKPKYGIKNFFDPKQSSSTSNVANGRWTNKSDGDKRKNIETNAYVDYDFDENVLAELPDDIRNEILNMRKRGENSTKSTSIKVIDDKTSREKRDSEGSDASSSYRKNNKVERLPSVLNFSQSKSSDLTTSSRRNEKEDEAPLALSQEIDESVLAELPEDIRNEIISSKKTVTKTSHAKTSQQKSEKIQTKQESYFKNVKATAERSSKVKMPPMRELDMAVLVELPEDIRNEIFNEYRVNNQGSSNDNLGTVEETSEAVVNGVDGAVGIPSNEEASLEANLSFSQVDPEYLAALPEDLRRDVKDYCMTKKMARKLNSKVTSKKNDVANFLNKFESATKSARSSKTKGIAVRNANHVKRKGAKKSTKGKEEVKGSKIPLNYKNGQKDQSESKRSTETQSQPTSVEEKVPTTATEITEILMEKKAIRDNDNTENDSKVDPFEEMKEALVEQFFDLSTDEVRMQIQTWISTCNTVNEIDLKSIKTFLGRLPKEKRIDDLHVLMKTMHRCVVKVGNCVWHRAYREIVVHVQQCMRVEYNSDLMLPQFECNRPGCNSDNIIQTMQIE